MEKVVKNYALIFFVLFTLVSLSVTAQTKPKRAYDSIKIEVDRIASVPAKIKLLLDQSGKSKYSIAEKLSLSNEAFLLANNNKLYKLAIHSGEKIADIYSNYVKDDPKAIEYYNICLQMAKEQNDTTEEAIADDYLGFAYMSINNFTKAIEYFNQAIALKLSPEKEMTTWGNMGVVYSKVGDYPKALFCYTQSIKVLDQFMAVQKAPDADDSLEMAGLIITIGEIYTEMHDYDKSLENFNKALQIGIAMKNYIPQIYASEDIGNIFELKNDFQRAIEQYKHSLQLCRNKLVVNEEATILKHLADIYLKIGNTSLALEFANKSLTIAIKLKDDAKVAAIYITLAKIITLQKKYDDAIGYLKKAINISEMDGMLNYETDAWQALSITYDAMKKPADAFSAYKHYITLRDSLSNATKNNEMIRLDLESQFSRKQIADSVRNVHQASEFKLKISRQRVMLWLGFIGLGLVILLLFFIYRNYTQQKNANTIISKANQTIIKANETIRSEKQVSENLLLNILPEEVAKELKTKGNVEARLFDNVTVLFTDFVNFTSAGERFTPQELVAELDNCFKAFDDIVSKYQVEKIKTVGDAYLAIAGVPRPNNAHASEMVRAAIEIRDFMVQRRKEHGNQTFEIRIGINSGTVVAGIVGTKKFAYDIWGDTVNVAARMEQYCEKGKINISQSTYELVKNEFNCHERGKIQVKNKGELNMFFVENKLL